ncbi:MAG: hypothetical protein Q9198_002038, partial [Flavoplaca austrocitrina]
ATPHPSTHQGSHQGLLRFARNIGTEADGQAATRELKKTLAVQELTKATKAMKKAQAQLDKAKKTKEVEVKKAFMASEARVNHAMVAMEASENRIAEIVDSGSAIVDEAIKTGDPRYPELWRHPRLPNKRRTRQTRKCRKSW